MLRKPPGSIWAGSLSYVSGVTSYAGSPWAKLGKPWGLIVSLTGPSSTQDLAGWVCDYRVGRERVGLPRLLVPLYPPRRLPKVSLVMGEAASGFFNLLPRDSETMKGSGKPAWFLQSAGIFGAPVCAPQPDLWVQMPTSPPLSMWPLASPLASVLCMHGP